MIDIRKYSKIFDKALGENQWAFTGSAALSMYGKNAKVKTRNVVNDLDILVTTENINAILDGALIIPGFEIDERQHKHFLNKYKKQIDMLTLIETSGDKVSVDIMRTNSRFGTLRGVSKFNNIPAVSLNVLFNTKNSLANVNKTNTNLAIIAEIQNKNKNYNGKNIQNVGVIRKKKSPPPNSPRGKGIKPRSLFF